VAARKTKHKSKVKAARRAAGVGVRPLLRAGFDAAQTTDDNRRHWANADALSADAALLPYVRRTLRMRTRYEVANNSWARGILLTLANHLIGTGPRLQIRTERKEMNRLLERDWRRWAQRIILAAKLRTMRLAKAQDGEAFAVERNNRGLGPGVQLDLVLVEADRVTTPDLMPGVLGAVDGIRFDADGNPEEYHILKAHPGGLAALMPNEYDRIPARFVYHWFRADRPEQHRGVSELVPALDLFANLRRYTAAVVSAAETAAEFAGFMKTTAPPSGEADEVDPMATMEIEKRMFGALPMGWETEQMKPEQPAATHEQFIRVTLNEIARCMNMPLNVAMCNSENLSYAGGRLDHQTYFQAIEVERADVETVVLDPLLEDWLDEELRVGESLAVGPEVRAEILAEIRAGHEWLWDGFEHVDPYKEAHAAAVLAEKGLLTEAEYCGRMGYDWEERQEQLKREAEGRRERGLPALVTAGAAANRPDPNAADDDEPAKRRGGRDARAE
jgi:lambda family phage portal protein